VVTFTCGVPSVCVPQLVWQRTLPKQRDWSPSYCAVSVWVVGRSVRKVVELVVSEKEDFEVSS